jgi:hypothetical protein
MPPHDEQQSKHPVSEYNFCWLCELTDRSSHNDIHDTPITRHTTLVIPPIGLVEGSISALVIVELNPILQRPRGCKKTQV